MSAVLYLVRRTSPDPVVAALSPDNDATVVLLEDAVTLRDVPAAKVYALAEDAASRQVTPAVPTITYRDLLELLFASDRIVTL